MAAIAAVVLGVFAWLSHRQKTAVVLVLAGCLGAGWLTAAYILKPLLRKPMVPAALKSLYEMQADATIRQLQALPKYDDPKRQTRFEAHVFSQGGEDGILREIFGRIGTTNKTFCEFGAADGVQNNTVLMLLSGWGGLWMDGDPEAIERAKARYPDAVKDGRLQVRHHFITAENVETLFADARLPEEFDLLSIDIDRNDDHVWQKVTRYRPRVVVIEYNSTFPPGIDWVVPYRADAWWDGSTTYFGASLTALERLGRSKGYSLVGCTLNGVNAFFVRADILGDAFSAPYTAEHHYEPPRLYLIEFEPGFLRNPR